MNELRPKFAADNASIDLEITSHYKHEKHNERKKDAGFKSNI